MKENVALAPFTTFGVGGRARACGEVRTIEEVQAALAYARERNLPFFVLGAGSNVLVPDAGVKGVVLRMMLRGISFQDEGTSVLLIAGAGTPWEEVVDAAGERGLFGIENLAGIPGTVGGAAVQNIGAYGAEFREVFEYADVMISATGGMRRIMRAEAAFAYRSSLFKEHRELVVTHVALRLQKHARPNLAYADLARAEAAGVPLTTSSLIARAVRAIRAEKFPRTPREGTAGSFFKNPIISRELAATLSERFPGLPIFPQEDDRVKVPLAWFLDHVLSLKGHAKGNVRLYEKQPLIVVAREGATATEIDAFALEIRDRVCSMTGIMVEREVETFGV